MFYSHDTYGLGNIRRTLSICKSLMEADPDYSILIISGSPMVHGFQIPRGADYVKLPCLTRTERDGYQSKFLGEDTKRMMRLRSEMILCATTNFRPDLIVVDKKPFGVQRELERALHFTQQCLPQTKLVLLLRDILDSPQATQKIWEKEGYFDAIRQFYEAVLVVGWPKVFDPCVEYGFPRGVKDKVQFCGYIEREPGRKSRVHMRNELGLSPDDRLALVTVGGGEDGGLILEKYLASVNRLNSVPKIKSLIMTGPEMPEQQKRTFRNAATRHSCVRIMEFTDDLMSHMDAADVVVSMGGYNTVCEILTLKKPAVIIPRVRPVEEQWIRAQRMAQLGLFTTIHPDMLTPQLLSEAVLKKLNARYSDCTAFDQLELGALPRISQCVSSVLDNQMLSGRHLSSLNRTGAALVAKHRIT